jgi:hypothetical protein
MPVATVVTNAINCVSGNAKTRGLQHLQYQDVGANSGRSGSSCIIHPRTDDDDHVDGLRLHL